MKTLSTIAIVGLLVLAADIGLARASDSSATSGAGQAGRTLGSAIREAGIGAAEVGKQIGHCAANFGREVGAGATSVAKEIGHGAAQAGRAIGGAAKDAGQQFARAFRGDKGSP